MLIDTILQHLTNRIEANELTNAELVQIIEHVGDYLNLATITAYAAANGISYNGAKKHRCVVNIFGCKFVIDNY